MFSLFVLETKAMATMMMSTLKNILDEGVNLY